MLKTTNKIEKIEILETDIKGKHLIRIYGINGKKQHIFTKKYFLEMKELKIEPLEKNEVGYNYNLDNFRISHDFKTNRILLYKIK